MHSPSPTLTFRTFPSAHTETLNPRNPTFLLSLWLLASTMLLSVSMTFLLLHIGGITQYLSFRDRLISLCRRTSMLTHVVACSFKAEIYSTVCRDPTVFIYSSVHCFLGGSNRSPSKMEQVLLTRCSHTLGTCRATPVFLPWILCPRLQRAGWTCWYAHSPGAALMAWKLEGACPTDALTLAAVPTCPPLPICPLFPAPQHSLRPPPR